jgi:hypothetical protein
MMASPKDPQSTAKKILATAAVLYCLVQWTGAHRMDGSAIFSEQRKTERTNLKSILEQLSTGLKQTCATGPARTVIFDDSDVLLPYILPATGHASIGHCQLIRETNVTPLSEASRTDCSSIRVIEYTPFMRKLQPSLALEPPPPNRQNWTQLFRWVSPQNDLGVALFRRKGCPGMEEAGDVQR